MPTSAIVGQARLPISEHDRLVRGVRAPEVEVGGLLRRSARTGRASSRRARTGAAARPLLPSVRFRPRKRFATGSRLDDPEEEEVEDDDEGERPERAEHLADDEADAHRTRPRRRSALVRYSALVAPLSRRGARGSRRSAERQRSRRRRSRPCPRSPSLHRRRDRTTRPASGWRTSATCSRRCTGPISAGCCSQPLKRSVR